MQQVITPEDVKIICTKSARLRTPVEVQCLAELTSNLKVFKSLNDLQGPYSHIICCRYLKYEFCDQNKYLFKYGDPGTRFYIIISGKVGVEVPMKNNKGETHMVEVMVLNNGAAFGELALESSKPRAASIKCKAPSHFMYLEKSDYSRLISRLISDKRNALVNFIQALPLFSHLTKGNLTKLSYIFKEKKFCKGQIVYNEQDVSDDVFFVRDGEFEFLRNISVKHFRSTSGIKKTFLAKTKKVANLGIGEMFGELEIFESLARKDTCRCFSATATVLKVSKIDFFKQLNTEEIIFKVKQRMIEKEEAIQKRISMLKNIEEGELQKFHRKRLSEEIESNDSIFVNKNFGSIDERNKGPRCILMRRNSVFLQSLGESENYTEKNNKKMGLKSKTFRSKLIDIEKFIPKSLNQKMFESQTYFSIFSNSTIK